MFDMLGTCRFQHVELGLDPEFYAQAYSAVVGKDFSLKDLFKCAERVWNLTRSIWAVRKGVKLEDDMLPERDFTDAVPEGSTKGAKLDKDKFRGMLRRYYEKRGWTPDGKPSKEKLVELGLSDAAKALYG
jgi:aldehyde:ferredoxin oxidoreductase